MATYHGTSGDDHVTGVASESNTFENFGIGRDYLVGGLKSDVFHLFADQVTDFIDGGYGIDGIDYSAADRALHIDLGSGLVAAAFSSSPLQLPHTVAVAHVQNIENATGSSFDDTIIGTDTDNTKTNGANVLDGGGGDDWLYGLGGRDVLLGGTGADHLYGGDQNDTLTGGLGDDYIDGGNGIDTVSYADVDRGTGNGVALNLGDLAQNGVLPREGYFYDPHANGVGFVGSIIETDTVVGVESAIGTSYVDFLMGNSQANTFDGGDGNDWLFGYGDDDTLIGGRGDDHLFGGEGADYLIGGEGSDWAIYNQRGFYGVNDIDYQPYYGNVVISLVNPASNTWEAAGDTYDGIENIVGSPFNDFITGDDHDNVIIDIDNNQGGYNFFYGNGGKDTFMGSPHHPDYFNGGNDENTVDYSHDTDAVIYLDYIHGYVTIDLENQNLNAGDAYGDRFTFIQDITGNDSPFSDTIYGDYSNNTFRGLGGDDRLMGRGGDDTLNGGAGDDTAVFSGNFADYTFRTLHFNDWSAPGGIGESFLEVHDTHTDRDGTDYVIEVEHLEFHDGTHNAADLVMFKV